MSDQPAANERMFSAALAQYEYATEGSPPSHHALSAAVRRVLELQREEIARAIEAAGVANAGSLRPGVAARIARDHGKEG